MVFSFSLLLCFLGFWRIVILMRRCFSIVSPGPASKYVTGLIIFPESLSWRRPVTALVTGSLALQLPQFNVLASWVSSRDQKILSQYWSIVSEVGGEWPCAAEGWHDHDVCGLNGREMVKGDFTRLTVKERCIDVLYVEQTDHWYGGGEWWCVSSSRPVPAVLGENHQTAIDRLR